VVSCASVSDEESDSNCGEDPAIVVLSAETIDATGTEEKVAGEDWLDKVMLDEMLHA
jgi:hypothetical protein